MTLFQRITMPTIPMRMAWLMTMVRLWKSLLNLRRVLQGRRQMMAHRQMTCRERTIQAQKDCRQVIDMTRMKIAWYPRQNTGQQKLMFWKRIDMNSSSSEKLLGSSRNQQSTKEIILKIMIKAMIPAITFNWSGKYCAGTFSLLSCTQKEKMILNIEKKTSIMNNRPKTIEYALSSFFILSLIFLEICYSSMRRQRRLAIPMPTMTIMSATIMRQSRLQLIMNSFYTDSEMRALLSVQILQQPLDIKSSKPFEYFMASISPENSKGHSCSMAKTKKMLWKVWISSRPIHFSKQRLTAKTMMAMMTRARQTYLRTLCIQRALSQVSSQLTPLSLKVVQSDEFQKYLVEFRQRTKAWQVPSMSSVQWMVASSIISVVLNCTSKPWLMRLLSSRPVQSIMVYCEKQGESVKYRMAVFSLVTRSIPTYQRLTTVDILHVDPADPLPVHAQFFSTAQILEQPSPLTVLPSSQPSCGRTYLSPQLMLQVKLARVVVPVMHTHLKPAESCRQSVSLQAVQRGVPVMLEIDVQPQTVLQKPLTTELVEQVQEVVPVKPDLQLVQAVELVQVRQPTITEKHSTQRAAPASRQPESQGQVVPEIGMVLWLAEEQVRQLLAVRAEQVRQLQWQVMHSAVAALATGRSPKEAQLLEQLSAALLDRFLQKQVKGAQVRFTKKQQESLILTSVSSEKIQPAVRLLQLLTLSWNFLLLRQVKLNSLRPKNILPGAVVYLVSMLLMKRLMRVPLKVKLAYPTSNNSTMSWQATVRLQNRIEYCTKQTAFYSQVKKVVLIFPAAGMLTVTPRNVQVP